jgi:hypothetical protein
VVLVRHSSAMQGVQRRLNHGREYLVCRPPYLLYPFHEVFFSKENSTHYLEQVLAPTIQRKIPFATTYGNVRLVFLSPRIRLTQLSRSTTTTSTSRMLLFSPASVRCTRSCRIHTSPQVPRQPDRARTTSPYSILFLPRSLHFSSGSSTLVPGKPTALVRSSRTGSTRRPSLGRSQPWRKCGAHGGTSRRVSLSYTFQRTRVGCTKTRSSRPRTVTTPQSRTPTHLACASRA